MLDRRPLAIRSLGAWCWPRFHHLVKTLIPLAGCGVFLGLSVLTVSSLDAEGLALGCVDSVRALLLAGAWLWSQGLAPRILRRKRCRRTQRTAAGGAMTAACALAAAAWYYALLAH